MNNVFALLAVAAMLFASGCIGAPIFPSEPQNDAVVAAPAPSMVYLGNNIDTHGCNEPEGYFWCSVKGKCIEIVKEKCQYDPPPSGVSAVSAQACVDANGTVVDDGICLYGTYSFAVIIGDETSKKVCCLPAVQAAE